MNIQQIETILDSNEALYNVDYVEIKSALNSALEKAKAAASAEYLKVVHQPQHFRTTELQDQYYGIVYPHTLPGWLKKLPKLASPAFAAALEAYRALEAFAPVCAKFVAAKTRVLKARKPSTTPRATPARTIDNTGTCACCGQNVKLDGGRIVNHGYTIRWGFQSGQCFGVGFRPIEVSDEGLRAAVQGFENSLAAARLTLEYNCSTRRQRAEAEGRISGAKSAIAFYSNAVKNWSPKALPDGNRSHL